MKLNLGFTDDHGDFSLSKTFKTVAVGVSGLALVGAAFGSFYVVDQSERAMVKNMGELQEGIVGPGPHLKIPFYQSVVTFSMKPRQMKLEKLETYTSDNQPITSTLNTVYQVPERCIPRLIAQPGWEERIPGVVVSRYKEVMGQENAVTVAQNRTKISTKLTSEVGKAALGNVCVEVTDIQLEDYQLAPEYMKNISQVANSKALAEKAKQDQIRFEIEAQNKKIVAEGDALRAIAEADGVAKSTRLKADANAYATIKQGDADASALKTKLSAVGNPQVLVDLANAEAWKAGGAQMPETLVTGGNATTLLTPAVKAATAKTLKP